MIISWPMFDNDAIIDCGATFFWIDFLLDLFLTFLDYSHVEVS